MHPRSAGLGLRSPFVALVTALAASLTVSACSGPPPRYPIREPARVLAVLQAHSDRVRSFHASGSADQFGPQGRVRGHVEIYTRQPNQLRVDTFAFNTLVSSLVSDGERFSMQQGPEYVTGAARPCVAHRLLGVPLEGREVVAVLSGGAPLVGEQPSQVRWEDGRYVIDVRGAQQGVTERMEFDLPREQRELPPERQEPQLRRVVLRDANGVRAEITYDGYRAVQGMPFPERVRLVMPRERVDMQIRFDRVEPNWTVPPDPEVPGPPPDPFRLIVPAGVEPANFEC